MALTINATILDGNMGDGWHDDYRAARAYATFLEERILAAYPDATVTVEVVRNTSGCTPPTSVVCDDYSVDDVAGYQLETRIQEHVDAISERAWEAFCESEVASSL